MTVDLETIVRALADADEPVERSQGSYCALCGEELQIPSRASGRWIYLPHDPACPWRMAREWAGLPAQRGPDGLLRTETT
jgi:hypothetical protein